MKTTNKIAIGILIGLGCVQLFNTGKYVGDEIYHTFKGHNETISAIEKVLKKHCNCDAESDISTVGISFSREDGVNGETARYTLKDFTKETSIEEEASRLNIILNEEVADFKKIDFVKLNFKDGNENVEAIIKNGTLQNKTI